MPQNLVQDSVVPTSMQPSPAQPGTTPVLQKVVVCHPALRLPQGLERASFYCMQPAPAKQSRGPGSGGSSSRIRAARKGTPAFTRKTSWRRTVFFYPLCLKFGARAYFGVVDTIIASLTYSQTEWPSRAAEKPSHHEPSSCRREQSPGV